MVNIVNSILLNYNSDTMKGINMGKKTGPKIKLNNEKLKSILPLMLQAPTPKYLAMGLGLNKTETVKNYISSGNALIEQFEDKLEELDNIIPFTYEQIFNQRIEEFEVEFCQLYDLEPNVPIPDRLYAKHEAFILEKKRTFVERKIEYKEREILNDIKLVDDEELDNEFKLLIRFARIYNRCRCMIEMGLLASITKHGMTSKNAPLGYKLLQSYNKEEFGEKTEVSHTGTIEVNTKSILALAMQYEKGQKEKTLQLENKQDNVIDVTPTNLLPKKEEI